MTGIPTLKFDATLITSAVLATAWTTLREYPEVIGPTFDTVHKAALGMIQGGGNQPLLFGALCQAGLSKSDASRITQHVWSRANGAMNRERMLRLGIREADWLYSGAPCVGVDHERHNGRRYLIEEGLPTPVGFVFPGDGAGCKCIPKPVISFGLPLP